MADAAAGTGLYAGLARFGREHRPAIEAVLREVEARGPLAASDLDGGASRPGWWEWSAPKRALEWLFWAGLVTTATRRGAFERVYDLPERALPRAALGAPTPARADAQRALVALALRAQGVATEADLRDYLRLPPVDARRALRALEEEGAAIPVRVHGWPPAWMDARARLPRRADARALICPFDPLVWTRPRAERLWGMRVRLEIYTPRDRRVHGYYVLPFLLGDRLVARVDLKADRAAGALVVQAAHAEPGGAGGHLRAPRPGAARRRGLARARRGEGRATRRPRRRVGGRRRVAEPARRLAARTSRGRWGKAICALRAPCPLHGTLSGPRMPGNPQSSWTRSRGGRFGQQHPNRGRIAPRPPTPGIGLLPIA